MAPSAMLRSKFHARRSRKKSLMDTLAMRSGSDDGEPERFFATMFTVGRRRSTRCTLRFFVSCGAKPGMRSPNSSCSEMVGPAAASALSLAGADADPDPDADPGAATFVNSSRPFAFTVSESTDPGRGRFAEGNGFQPFVGSTLPARPSAGSGRSAGALLRGTAGASFLGIGTKLYSSRPRGPAWSSTREITRLFLPSAARFGTGLRLGASSAAPEAAFRRARSSRIFCCLCSCMARYFCCCSACCTASLPLPPPFMGAGSAGGVRGGPSAASRPAAAPPGCRGAGETPRGRGRKSKSSGPSGRALLDEEEESGICSGGQEGGDKRWMDDVFAGMRKGPH